MTEENIMPCPICKLDSQDVVQITDHGHLATYNCARCHKFTITGTAEAIAENKQLGVKLSAWIRSRNMMGSDIPVIN